MGFAPTITDEDVAAAVNAHCKALRILGREGTDVGSIAKALGVESERIELVFSRYRITASAVNPQSRRSVSRVVMEFTPTVSFKKRK